MPLQIAWSPWIGVPLVVDLDLEAAAIISFGFTQPLEGTGLRVLYLANKVSCQLVGEDMPQVPMDPHPFHAYSILHDRYWVPVVEEWHTLRLAALGWPWLLWVYLLSFLFPFYIPCLCCMWWYSNVLIMLGYGWPILGGPVDPPHLPWLVYTWGTDGFARERPVGRNPNVISYPFPQGTQVVSPFYHCPFHFPFIPFGLILTLISFSNLAYCSRAWGACLACRESQARGDWVF